MSVAVSDILGKCYPSLFQSGAWFLLIDRPGHQQVRWPKPASLRTPHLFSGPLEPSHDAVLDLVKVLHSLGHVHQEVGSGSVGSEAPDLTGLGDIPLVFVSQVTAAGLELLTGRHVALVDVFGETVGERLGLHVQTVVLVGRLGQTQLVWFCADRLPVGHNGVRFLLEDQTHGYIRKGWLMAQYR